MELKKITDEPPFIVRRIIKDEAEAAYAVHLSARAGMECSWVRSDTLNHFRSHVRNEGITVAAFTKNDDKMVAYGILGLHSQTVANIAQALGVDLSASAHFAILDGAACLPDWQGLKLHRRLILERLKLAKALGRRTVGATVSPHNVYSMIGLFDTGFSVRKYSALYGSSPRFVMQRDLFAKHISGSLPLPVALHDIDGHVAALAKGLVGVACAKRHSDTWEIHYVAV